MAGPARICSIRSFYIWLLTPFCGFFSPRFSRDAKRSYFVLVLPWLHHFSQRFRTIVGGFVCTITQFKTHFSFDKFNSEHLHLSISARALFRQYNSIFLHSPLFARCTAVQAYRTAELVGLRFVTFFNLGRK